MSSLVKAIAEGIEKGMNKNGITLNEREKMLVDASVHTALETVNTELVGNTTITELKEMVKIQGNKGNYDYSQGMTGMYNGMELMLAMIEGREPNYKVYKEEEADGTTNK